VPELTLDERIGVLTGLLGGDDCADRPGVCGALGEAWLERYSADPDGVTLRVALGYLTEAAAAAPDHEDRMAWWFWLGTGHAEQAVRTRSPQDFDHAIRWLTRLVDAVPLDDPDYDLAVLAWLEAHWDRYRMLRHVGEPDPETLRAESDRLVSALSSRMVTGTHPDAPYVARMFYGLARLDRYGQGEDRADLDAGLAALAEALPHVPSDTASLDIARAELADAYLVRAGLDGDERMLDLAVEEGEAALDAIDPDDPLWRLAHLHQADACQQRWWRHEDPADLDRAIACWQVLLSDDPDGYYAGSCGDLLSERAERTGDRADVVEAVRLLELSTAGDPGAWQPWFALGVAYQRHAGLLGGLPSWHAAVRCFDRALSLDVDDDDVRLSLHHARLSSAMEAVRAEGSRPRTAPPPGTVRVRELIVESGELLDRATDADLTERALLAGQLAMAEAEVTGYDLGVVDADRVLRRFALARLLPDAPVEWSAVISGLEGLIHHIVDGNRGRGPDALADLLRDPALDSSMRRVFRRSLPGVLLGGDRASWARRRLG
jgi:tetratricopeptide (TPR) repeat protein